MATVRTVKTGSGATVVQIVRSLRRGHAGVQRCLSVIAETAVRQALSAVLLDVSIGRVRVVSANDRWGLLPFARLSLMTHGHHDLSDTHFAKWVTANSEIRGTPCRTTHVAMGAAILSAEWARFPLATGGYFQTELSGRRMHVADMRSQRHYQLSFDFAKIARRRVPEAIGSCSSKVLRAQVLLKYVQFVGL